MGASFVALPAGYIGADGTQFIEGFYDFDKRGFLQRRSGIKKGRNLVVSTLFPLSA